MFKMAKSIKGMLAVVIIGTVLASLFIPVLSVSAAPQAPVDLGSAGNFAILAETGISTTGTTHITGDIGISPYAATSITGFNLALDPSGTFATPVPASLVTGRIYAADYALPTPTYLGTAVGDMYDAYTDAAGRPTPDFINAGGGNIGGLNLAPGLYNWNSGVTIATDVTLTGSASDVWIFQISGTLDVSSGVHVNLSPGVLASNIFWQVTGQTTLGTGSTMNGNILDQTTIVLNTGAALNGRALAQAAVTLDSNAVINPDLLPPTTYNLTYTAGIGGTITAPASSPTTHNTGAVVTITAVAGAGYHFVNWTGDVSTVVSASTASTTLTMNGDYSITANFAPNSYTVTFNNNGGSGVTPTSESATFGQLVTAPTTAPTWAGHILTGWYTLASGGTLWNFGTTTMTAGNMTLYAQWNLAPTVISTVPANGAGGVAINSAITATFSIAMNSSTILAPGTFTLKQGSTLIGGTVSYAGVTATFHPTVSLAYGTTYTATISTAAQDLAGNALAVPYVWAFTTGSVSVGGQAYPINTTTILVSALILAVIVTLGARALVLRRRASR